jgi:hypothetical protein
MLTVHGARITSYIPIAVSIRLSNAMPRFQGTADFANVIHSQLMLPNRESAIGVTVRKQGRFLLSLPVA